MRIILILSILSFCSFIYAQEINCDTLAKNVKDALHNYPRAKTEANIEKFLFYKDTVPIECLTAQVYLQAIDSRINTDTGNIEMAFQKLDDAFTIAEKTDNATLKKYTLRLKASNHFNNKQIAKAIKAVNQALTYPCNKDSLFCFEENINLLINRGLYLTKFDKYEEAIENYNKADSLIDYYGLNNPLFRVAINNSLGRIFFSQTKDPEKSTIYFKKAFEACPPKHRGKMSLANNLATIYKEIGAIDSSKVYLNYIINSTKLPSQLVSPYIIFGFMERDSNNYEAALDYFETALGHAKKSGLIKKINLCKEELGKTYYLLDKYKQADIFLEEVNAYNRSNPPQKNAILEHERYYYLNKIALKNPNYSKSFYQHLINYDSLYGEERLEKIDKLLYKYENKIVADSLNSIKITSQNQTLKLKNQKLSIFSLLSALTASFFAILFIFRKLKESKVKNEELIFQNNELQKVNEQLELKTKALLKKPKVEGAKEEITIKTKDKSYFVPLNKITYVQAEDDGVRVYFEDTSKWTDISLKNFNQELNSGAFVQIGRGVIVNIKHIAWINTNTLKMKAGAELKIGRTYKPQIKAMLES